MNWSPSDLEVRVCVSCSSECFQGLLFLKESFNFPTVLHSMYAVKSVCWKQTPEKEEVGENYCQDS